jgi:hypothetical protein
MQEALKVHSSKHVNFYAIMVMEFGRQYGKGKKGMWLFLKTVK